MHPFVVLRPYWTTETSVVIEQAGAAGGKSPWQRGLHWHRWWKAKTAGATGAILQWQKELAGVGRVRASPP